MDEDHSPSLRPARIYERMSLGVAADNISRAVHLAERYGMIDGAHHKQWVIDQMIQATLGPDLYKLWLAEYNQARVADGYDPWDPGIAP